MLTCLNSKVLLLIIVRILTNRTGGIFCVAVDLAVAGRAFEVGAEGLWGCERGQGPVVEDLDSGHRSLQHVTMLIAIIINTKYGIRMYSMHRHCLIIILLTI